MLTGDPLMIYKSLEQDRWRFFRHIPIIIIFLSLSTGRLPFLISLWQLLSERSGYDNGFTKRLIYFLSGTSLGHRESERELFIKDIRKRNLMLRKSFNPFDILISQRQVPKELIPRYRKESTESKETHRIPLRLSFLWAILLTFSYNFHIAL